MDFSYVFTSKATKKTDLWIFFVKEWKKKKKRNENVSSSSTGREKLIDPSNKLQDEYWKVLLI